MSNPCRSAEPTRDCVVRYWENRQGPCHRRAPAEDCWQQWPYSGKLLETIHGKHQRGQPPGRALRVLFGGLITQNCWLQGISMHLKAEWEVLVFEQRVKWQEVRVFWQTVDEIGSPKIVRGVGSTWANNRGSQTIPSRQLFSWSAHPVQQRWHLALPKLAWSPCLYLFHLFCYWAAPGAWNSTFSFWPFWGPTCLPILVALLPPNPNLPLHESSADCIAGTPRAYC